MRAHDDLTADAKADVSCGVDLDHRKVMQSCAIDIVMLRLLKVQRSTSKRSNIKAHRLVRAFQSSS